MTNGLIIFLALYALVGQPAIVGWMIDNTQLYQLAWLNAWIFLIALIISSMCKPNKSKTADNTSKLVEKSEERVSRIENQDGIAIVEVEKKHEVSVETWNNEAAEEVAEPEKLEEKPEEKKEEKSEERPMKETVTIPKIVQPLTWHSAPKKRKKERKWGQRLVMLLTLAIAWVIAYTLWEFLGNRWIAIALFLGWLLYLVIGKLFDINWFYNAKKLFTNRLYIILILAWIGYWVYAMQQQDKSFNLLPEWWSDNAIEYVKGRFKHEESESVDTTAIYIFEGTGEVISNTWDTEILNNTWFVETWVVESWAVENETGSVEINTGSVENSEVVAEPVAENQTPELSPEEAKKQVTMWEAVKSLLSDATLSTKTNTTFKYVSKSNELYPYFKTAQEKWMIWTDTDPSKIISCETYITMKWLREWWNVWNYVKSEIKSAYWKKATELWKLNGCQKWKYVTKWNL